MDTREAQALAIELMHTHKLIDWRFQFDESVRRFGCCNYRIKIISLSRVLVN